MTDGELNSRVHGDRYGSGQWGAVKRWLVGGSDGHSISSLADWAVGGHHGVELWDWSCHCRTTKMGLLRTEDACRYKDG